MGAVDRPAALGEALMDAAAPEVGRVAGELEGDPDVVEVRWSTRSAISRLCSPSAEPGRRWASAVAGFGENLRPSRLVGRVDLEDAGGAR